MCKALDEGGQRCAAHTRGPAYAALAVIQAKGAAALTESDSEALAAYASTPSGAEELRKLVEAALRNNDFDTAACLSTALRDGALMRESNAVVGAAIAAAKEPEKPVAPQTVRMDMRAHSCPACGQMIQFTGDWITALRHHTFNECPRAGVSPEEEDRDRGHRKNDAGETEKWCRDCQTWFQGRRDRHRCQSGPAWRPRIEEERIRCQYCRKTYPSFQGHCYCKRSALEAFEREKRMRPCDRCGVDIDPMNPRHDCYVFHTVKFDL